MSYLSGCGSFCNNHYGGWIATKKECRIKEHPRLYSNICYSFLKHFIAVGIFSRNTVFMCFCKFGICVALKTLLLDSFVGIIVIFTWRVPFKRRKCKCVRIKLITQSRRWLSRCLLLFLRRKCTKYHKQLGATTLPRSAWSGLSRVKKKSISDLRIPKAGVKAHCQLSSIPLYILRSMAP